MSGKIESQKAWGGPVVEDEFGPASREYDPAGDERVVCCIPRRLIPDLRCACGVDLDDDRAE